MKLVVGLGNPGPKYALTRHNVGFLTIDGLVDRWNAQGPKVAFDAEMWQAEVEGEKIVFAKPLTFMNLSGRSVGPMMTFFKLKPEDLIVIHDELDLKPMQMRIKTGGGTAGHNGLKSIDEALGAGNQGYHRIRMGIGHPRALGLKIEVADYVLQRYAREDAPKLGALWDDVEDALKLIFQGKANEAMTRFNRDRLSDGEGEK